MKNSLELENSWVRETIEELEYPIASGELLSVFQEAIHPELPKGLSLDPDEDDLEHESYESVEEAWDELEKNLLISTDMISLPDNPATED